MTMKTTTLEDRSRWNAQAAKKRRQREKETVQELKWDDDARADYLTGFHKRKVEIQITLLFFIIINIISLNIDIDKNTNNNN